MQGTDGQHCIILSYIAQVNFKLHLGPSEEEAYVRCCKNMFTSLPYGTKTSNTVSSLKNVLLNTI